MMKKSVVVLIVSALGLSACSNAKTANEVNAAYVPTGKYERMSCKSLRSENREAERELADMTAAIEKSYRDDKTAEVVAWFLFAPALLMMDGNSEEQKEYGEAKGRVLAIQDVMDSKGC
jgi:hypothetical protein